MPTGQETFVESLNIWTHDGKPITLGSFNGVVTEDYEREHDEETIKLHEISDFSATFTLENTYSAMKSLVRLSYGWKARGPIRKRVLDMAIRKKIRSALMWYLV